MFYSPNDCGGEGGNWQTIGWFAVAPGQCTTVYANSPDDVNNRLWYFYAENTGATVVWNGLVYVTDAAFDHCYAIGTSESRIVGFRMIDVGDNDDYTLNLAP